jgi:hypothetical protein
MNRTLLAIGFAVGLAAPAFAGNCADLGRGMRFCDQSGGANGQTTSQGGASTSSQGHTTSSQSNTGSNQTGR